MNEGDSYTGREAFALAAGKGARVLIVEDDADVRHMLASLLGSHGFAVSVAASAVECVAAAGGVRPDLILMDLGLPDADGMTAVRAIRSHAGLADVPIIIVSAYDSMQFRAEAVDANCAAYVVKPVNPEHLLETIRLLTLRGRA